MMTNAQKICALHVITSLGRGGAERSLLNLLTSNFREQVQNVVVSLGGDGVYGAKLRAAGISVYSLGLSKSPVSWWRLFRLLRLLREHRPDVIHGWMYHANLVVLLIAPFVVRPVRIFWSVRNALYDIGREKCLTRWVIRAHLPLCRRVTGIIYNSEVSRKQHENYGFARKLGVVIPNGFDLDWWVPRPELVPVMKAALGIPLDSFVIGHVARFHPMKDHATLLAAIAQVMLTRPHVHVVLAGRGLESSNSELADALSPLPLDRLHLLGDRDDVEKLMVCFNVFCLSSWSEAFPNVLGEAMACGIFCVATDVGDARAVLGEVGLIVPPKSPTALAGALLQVVDMPSDALAALSRAARARILCYYSLQATAKRYLSIYCDLQRH
jgi:glycosyltransferase involved in cell wall biosynthesis